MAGGASGGTDTRERVRCATRAASTPLEVTGPGRMGIGRAWRGSARGVGSWMRGGATLGGGSSVASGARGVGSLGGACWWRHVSKRPWRSSRALSWLAVTIGGACLMVAARSCRAWVILSAGVTVGWVRYEWRNSTVSDTSSALVLASMALHQMN